MSEDIKSWLEQLGLGKYAEVFSENEIDFRALPRLNEDDLKDLGLPLGARRNLQTAIEQLPKDLIKPKPPAQIESTTSGEAERRQLTVMFCDLVGSTELSRRIDPEDLRDINRVYQDACKVAVERYEGYVARYMGDGVPLFVEELTKSVIESATLEDGSTIKQSELKTSFSIPETLQDSLMARLDRLKGVRKIVQLAATIGRQFTHQLLVAASEDEREMNDGLSQLREAGLIYQIGTPPDASYEFKHALVRDAAYESILKSKRRELHARIAKTVESRFPDIVTEQPEVLAHHCAEAGESERAVALLLQAGQNAIQQSANREAIVHLTDGLDLLNTLPESDACDHQELALQAALAVPLIFVKGWSTPEVEHAYLRAQALCDKLGRKEELIQIKRGLWNYYLDLGEHKRAHGLAEGLVSVANQKGNTVQRALSRRALGTSLFSLGRFADAAVQLEEGVLIDDALTPSDRRASLSLYGDSAGVVCRLYGGWNLWFSGFPDRAIELLDTGSRLSRKLSFTHSIAWALCSTAATHNFRGEFTEALKLAEVAIASATEHGLAAWMAIGDMCRGFALSGLGENETGLDLLHNGLAKWREPGAQLCDTQWLGMIAAAQIRVHKIEEAWATLDEAVATSEATSELYYRAELDRLQGVLLHESGKTHEAEAQFQVSIDRACAQGAHSLELRTATDLASLWHEQSRSTEAHDLLAPVYSWFTEGLDTVDLQS